MFFHHTQILVRIAVEHYVNLRKRNTSLKKEVQPITTDAIIYRDWGENLFLWSRTRLALIVSRKLEPLVSPVRAASEGLSITVGKKEVLEKIASYASLYQELNDYPALTTVDSSIPTICCWHLFLYSLGRPSTPPPLMHREKQLRPKVGCKLEILKCFF